MKVRVLIVLALLGFSFLHVVVAENGTRGSTVDWKLFIPGEKEQFHSGYKVLVAGIETNLTFYAGASRNITVFLKYSGLNSSSTENDNNYYEWSYGKDGFRDVLYGKYINRTASSLFTDKYGYEIAFHIGIHANAAEGLWNLTVSRDLNGNADTIIDETIYVESPNPDIALSTPVFEFRVEPFSGDSVIGPTQKDYKFRTVNNGNLPMRLTCYYDKMSEIFDTSHMNTILHPNETLYHTINMTSLPWSPQVFTVTEHVRGTPLHIITPDMISFIQVFQGIVKINVKVVRSGFDIIDIGNAKMQYERGPLSADYGENMKLRLFLTGTSDTQLTVSVDKVELLGVRDDRGVWHNESGTSRTLDFSLSNMSKEKEVIVAIKCYRGGVVGRVSYRIASGGNESSAYTDISVNKEEKTPVPQQTGGLKLNPTGTAIAVAVLFAVISGFGYYIMKNRKNEEKDKIGKRNDGRKSGKNKKRRKR